MSEVERRSIWYVHLTRAYLEAVKASDYDAVVAERDDLLAKLRVAVEALNWYKHAFGVSRSTDARVLTQEAGKRAAQALATIGPLEDKT